MFGQISNWINTNVPEVKMPEVSMPKVSMPSMPHMPKMPDIFGKKSGEEGGGGEGAAAAEGGQIDTGNMEPQQEQQEYAQQQSADVPTTSEAAAAASGDENGAAKFHINTTEINQNMQKGIGHAKELGSNIGNMIFSFGKNASSSVMKGATQLKDVIEKKTIIGDFTKENEKFVNDKKSQQRREDAAVPPWVGYNEEEVLKEQIVALSTDSRNFLRSPPTGVDFQFDFNIAYPIAMATLDEDANLKDMRFKLVPSKINEESFWRNYFYRVTLIKQSILLDQTYVNDKNQDFQSRGSDPNAASQAANDSAGEIEDGEWDKELPEDLDSISPEELEKEINQMIGKWWEKSILMWMEIENIQKMCFLFVKLYKYSLIFSFF